MAKSEDTTWVANPSQTGGMRAQPRGAQPRPSRQAKNAGNTQTLSQRSGSTRPTSWQALESIRRHYACSWLVALRVYRLFARGAREFGNCKKWSVPIDRLGSPRHVIVQIAYSDTDQTVLNQLNRRFLRPGRQFIVTLGHHDGARLEILPVEHCSAS